MSKVSNIKRIVKEDFAPEDQALIDRLAFALNPFLEQVSAAFSKGIDDDNLNQQSIFVEVEVNVQGIPKTPLQIKIDTTLLKTRIKGSRIILAQNLTDGTFPTATPFLTFNVINGLINVQHVAGLPADKRFRLSVILIG